jgi:class 3 adenylate cyclase/tetratricopeptide (TPR) repeat protein
MICARCGHENGDAARFCESCGAPLAAASTERRKVVSVVFCDVVGSTELGDSTDPEALRALLARYFDRMRGIVEGHGGSVEKFIGDAVMAVFGVPAVHEDDALRACRAALEMRDAFWELGIEGRLGVSTGEVVTGTVERLATGDALNVAARLQQAAQPGDVLIESSTRLMAGDAVDVDAVEPQILKGKRNPVTAFRLIAAREASERTHDLAFVGRERELAALNDAWSLAVAEKRCELVTVVGDAGIGKSRLVVEALRGVHAPVVRGRCPPYGAGITYWPVVEVVKQLGALPVDPAAAAAIRSLLGGNEGTSADEIAWAFRKLLEEQAPVVVLFDDVQWGEETFLDLVEHVALLSSGAPILILCMTRPDLLDRRPSWPVTFRLAPLGDGDTNALISTRVPTDLGKRIAAASAGNPLFIGEMLALAGEGTANIDVPATLKALLAARLDQLDARERRVLEGAAVEGELFHRGAVQVLVPEELQLSPRLAALARRELIRSEQPQLIGEDGFRFRHLLVRDAAYSALPKAIRADLHVRYASWIEQRGSELVERDEILGYHLEQAARYKEELGRSDPSLAERAGMRLAAAGRTAAWRGDDRTAAGLLQRALSLTRPTHLDVMTELDLAKALGQRDPESGAAVAESAAARAHEAGDAAGELLARVGAAGHRSLFAEDPAIDELERLAHAALPLLERAENHAGLAYVWSVLGSVVANFRGRNEQWAHAAERAIHHGRLAGHASRELFDLPAALMFGPRPTDEAILTLDAILPNNPHPEPVLCRAVLVAMLGRSAEADEIARDASARFRDLTGDDDGEIHLGLIAATAGRHQDAVTHFRRFCDLLEARGQRSYLSVFAPMLGRSLCELGRYDEAEPLAQLGRELGDEHDTATQALWRQVQARVEAGRGRLVEAEKLARDAVAINERTDSLNALGDALCDLAEILRLGGDLDQAEATLVQALERYEQKKNLALAARARDRLAALRS